MRVLIFLLLIGCSQINKPSTKDTRFDPNKRDWEQVYKQELISALENDDEVAFYFFWRYYLEERYNNKLKNLK